MLLGVVEDYSRGIRNQEDRLYQAFDLRLQCAAHTPSSGRVLGFWQDGREIERESIDVSQKVKRGWGHSPGHSRGRGMLPVPDVHGLWRASPQTLGQGQAICSRNSLYLRGN